MNFALGDIFQRQATAAGFNKGATTAARDRSSYKGSVKREKFKYCPFHCQGPKKCMASAHAVKYEVIGCNLGNSCCSRKLEYSKASW